MPHIPIILDAKLDCISKRFEGLSATVEALREACHAAELIVQAELNSAEVSPLHAQLHAVQLLATNLCDNENAIEAEVCAQIEAATEELNKLM